MRPHKECPLYRAVVLGEIVSGEEIVRHLKTGELRHCEYTSAPMCDRNDRIFGGVAVVRDITEHKRLVHDLQEALADVEPVEKGILEL